MNKPRSSTMPPQTPSPVPELATPEPDHPPGVAGADKVPSVTKLFSRMFGTGAARTREHGFLQTEWQETEWLDTGSQPPRA